MQARADDAQSAVLVGQQGLHQLLLCGHLAQLVHKGLSHMPLAGHHLLIQSVREVFFARQLLQALLLLCAEGAGELCCLLCGLAVDVGAQFARLP